MTLMWEARKELTSSKMGELARHFWIKTTQSEPAEFCIREAKKAVRHIMLKTRASKYLRGFFTTHHCELHFLIAHPHPKLQGHTPCKIVTGRTPVISEYLDYAWYDTIWYYEQDITFLDDHHKLGKVLYPE